MGGTAVLTTAIPFRIEIPGEPVGQPRQRHRIVNANGRQEVQNYTPKRHPVTAYKQAVQLQAASGYVGDPLTVPVKLEAAFVFPRPQRLTWKTKPMPRAPHRNTPDVDNLLKAIKDALTGVLWRDDRQVAAVTASKWYAAGGESPHTEIVVRTLMTG